MPSPYFYAGLAFASSTAWAYVLPALNGPRRDHFNVWSQRHLEAMAMATEVCNDPFWLSVLPKSCSCKNKNVILLFSLFCHFSLWWIKPVLWLNRHCALRKPLCVARYIIFRHILFFNFEHFTRVFLAFTHILSRALYCQWIHSNKMANLESLWLW